MVISLIHVLLQDGDTPLMREARRGQVKLVQLLLEKGAQVDHQDKVSVV